jgi:hypothetical protein
MRFFYTPTTVVFYVLLTVWSAATFWVEMIGRPLRALAERIEARASPVGVNPEQLRRLFDARRAMASCARESVRSGASVELFALDAAAMQGDLADEDLREADQLLRQALRCFPTDGNLWLRLAMIDVVRTGTFQRAAEMVTQSAMVSPSEGWILRARLAWVSQIDERGLGLMIDVLWRDVMVYAEFALPADVARAYIDGNRLLRQIFDASLAGAKAERRALVWQEIAHELSRRSLSSAGTHP